MTTPSADDFLMGGAGAPTAKFDRPGTSISGPITEPPTVQQQRDIKTGEKKFWPDGNPMNQLVVTVQTPFRAPSITDDDGRRRIFIKGQMKTAIQDAVRASGARGLEVGGVLTVTYTHDGEATQRGFSPPKQYRAEYIPALAAEFGAPATPPPAPAQYAAPAATSYPAPPAAAPAPTPVAAPVPGLTAEQIAAAQQDPTTAALLAQLQARQAPAAQPPLEEPPF